MMARATDHWDPSQGGRYTAIWQSNAPTEREWIDEIMGHYIAEHVTDGKHVVVLDDAILLDAFTNCYDPAYYARFRGKNAFLASLLDETFEGGLRHIRELPGRLSLLLVQRLRSTSHHENAIGYCNGARAADRSVPKASERAYLWSFLGSAEKSTRPDMFRELATLEPHFFVATVPMPGRDTSDPAAGLYERLSPAEFSRVLPNSAFSPCPMGNVNIESYRVYESLECGAIPIVEKRLTLDYYRDLLGDHPLPTVRSWAEARTFIANMMRKPAEMDALQQRCRIWWTRYKLDYTARVGQFLAHRSSAPSEIPRVSNIHTFPGWRITELLRHHDTRAIARRVQRQVVRLVKHRKIRETHRPGKQSD